MQKIIDVSVVIPAFNEEDFLARAIDSVLNQSFLPKEIIVVDDGSTDGTGDIANRYRNVHYIRKENAGLAAARNTGITASKCEFVAFLDSDDEWNPGHLKNSWLILSSNPEVNWCCSSYDRRLVNGEVGFTKNANVKWIGNGIIENYFDCEAQEHFSLPTVMIVRREIFAEVGMFDVGISQLGEDIDMWFRIALEYPSIAYSTQVGAQYWERKGSIMGKLNVIDIPRFLRRIQRSESAALVKGLEARKVSEPLVIDWINRAIKVSIKQVDKECMAYIYKYYGGRISFKYHCLLVISMNLPAFVFKLIFDKRKTAAQ